LETGYGKCRRRARPTLVVRLAPQRRNSP
jgi:hypothetical protein